MGGWRRLGGDQRGAVFVETALVLPLMLLLVVASIDLGLLMWQWNSASKAAHLGARQAVTSDPVAKEITTDALVDAADWPNTRWKTSLMGSTCTDEATGDARVGGGTSPYATYCPSLESQCSFYDDDGTHLGELTCTNGFTANTDAFDEIRAKMQKAFGLLAEDEIQVTYKTNGLGFVGRPNGLIMDVSVSIRCKTFDLLALDALAGIAGVGQCGKSGFPIPSFTTTLPSEDMQSDSP